MTRLTKAQLEELVATLRAEAAAAQQARETTAADLQTAQQALTNAQAEAATAQQAATAAQAAQAALQQQLQNVPQGQGLPGAGVAVAGNAAAPANLPMIDRPTGTRWSIHEAMQVTRAEYAEVQRTIRSLVIRAQLDWTEDFRRQDPERLATLFRAARTAHPVLRRYTNNWAAAAIARQYMSNKRKHAYKQGYIKKRGPADKENFPRPGGGGGGRDDEGSAGSAGTVA